MSRSFDRTTLEREGSDPVKQLSSRFITARKPLVTSAALIVEKRPKEQPEGNIEAGEPDIRILSLLAKYHRSADLSCERRPQRY